MPYLFRRRVAEAPAGTALVDERRTVTYGELDRLSDVLAGRLIELGIGNGDFVAVVLPRCVELVVAMLGVLKAGAAYSVLDPLWPADHFERIVGRLTPSAVVASSQTATRYRGGRPVLALDTDFLDTAMTGPRPAVPDAAALPDEQPSCVFFTSGTTGEPKGSVSSHRAVVRVVVREGREWFDRETVMPATAPPAWDAFALELWGALLNGGTSVLCESSYLLPGTLRELVRRHGVNTIWLTTSLFNLLVEEAAEEPEAAEEAAEAAEAAETETGEGTEEPEEPEAAEDADPFAGIRLVLTGGERMSIAHARAFLARRPATRLINAYGPVECTIFTTTYEVTEEDLDGGDIPVGRPVAGTEVFVRKDGRPCGPGEVGEIQLAGEGLSLGYVNNPEATGNAFEEAVVDGRRRRLYRTGDLGWWSRAGALHFTGRADRQVKIRGHRVEPAHVEKAVTDASGGQRCHVLPVPGPGGSYRALAAFLVGGSGPSPADVLSRLRESVPAYLVPQHIVATDGVPLTANGKLDEKALLRLLPTAAPGSGAPQAGEEPSGAISEIYAQVLGAGFRSPREPLFSMGGTSLDAVRICSRLHARFGVSIPVGLLLKQSSVREAYALVEAALAARRPAQPAIENSPLPYVPLLPAQAEAWFEEMVTPDPASGNCLMDWHIQGATDSATATATATGTATGTETGTETGTDVDIAALRAAARDVHQRHESLRAGYTFVDEPVALLGEGPPEPEFHLRTAAGPSDADEAWLLGLLRAPFDIESGRIWRLGVLTAPGLTRVGISVDHTAFDGWSEALLTNDLSIAYQARRAGRAPVFPGPAPTFAALWREHREQQSASGQDDSHAFWRAELRNIGDLSFPPVARGESTCDDPVRAAIRRPQWEACGRFAAEHGVTLFTVLFALYAESVARVTSSENFAIGIPFAHRGTALRAIAVGCLTGTVCVPVPGAAGSLEEAVLGASHRLRRVLSHADVPLPEVARLSGRHRGERAAMFQSVFALQDNATPLLALGDRTAQLHRPTAHGSVAELVAEVWPQPGDSAAATLRLTYDPDAVPRATVLEVAAAFGVLLDEVLKSA